MNTSRPGGSRRVEQVKRDTEPHLPGVASETGFDTRRDPIPDDPERRHEERLVRNWLNDRPEDF